MKLLFLPLTPSGTPTTLSEREVNRQGAKDAKEKTMSWRSWRSWRFEVLLVSGGFNPFVALAHRAAWKSGEQRKDAKTQRRKNLFLCAFAPCVEFSLFLRLF
ncbi:hypothetical protein [Sorangium sp. So ce1335]|uniref:hypothetical protein n=1 Tax=Sorangium sp. So ce1335 TaxID=3133335 RepID=UPI003F62248A